MKIPVSLGKDSYEITLERGALDKIETILDLERKVLVVSDNQVPLLYAEKICKASKKAVLARIPSGEASKNLDNFSYLCKVMLDNGFTRKDCVVAVGGGVVGDLAGFAAACFMRGIDFYNIPTTLLSQVDSSVGGKTAVDFCGIKNIIGAFYQPKAVVIDPDVLKTLDKRQFACGCAEIIKMAATFDKDLFELIEIFGIEQNLESIIASALKIKARVVELDEKEQGLRKVLNFGHTLGHGIESSTNLLHGECVALGMLTMTEGPVRERLKALLEKENLPVTCNADSREVVDAAMHDKKSEGDEIVTVRVRQIGIYEFEKSTKEELLSDYEETFK